MRNGFIVFLVTLVYYLLLNSNLPITDPVESNYALTAKEMVLTGDWLSPQIYGHYWFDKPIMIYWLIAVSYKLFGIGEFAARFPAAIFSAASVTLIYWYANKVFAEKGIGLMCAVILATSLEFWVISRMVITDAVLFFFSSTALAAFYLGVKTLDKRYLAVFYISMGLAVLTKGPVGVVLPLIVVFCYVAITKQWVMLKRMWFFSGTILFLLVTLPWYGAMYSLHGSNFINDFFGLHNYIRATVSEHPKDNVFYYYLVLFPVSVLPWTGLLIRSIFHIKEHKENVFFFIWLVTIIAFYSLMATKYPTYVFPAMFPAALLMGYTLQKMVRGSVHKSNWLWLSVPAIFLLIAFAVGAKFVPQFVNRQFFYGISIFFILLILWLQVKSPALLYRALPVIVAITSMVLIYNVLVPLTWSRSAKSIANELPTGQAVIACYGEYATSAVFYSEHVIFQLTESEEKPDQQDVWAGKYKMPTKTIIEFIQISEANPNAYILVKDKYQDNFRNSALYPMFEVVSHKDAIYLYKKRTNS